MVKDFRVCLWRLHAAYLISICKAVCWRFRFTIYVHPAVASAPVVGASSSGRSAYSRFLETELACYERKLFGSFHPLAASVMVAQHLMFPELRLIEYDCGKWFRKPFPFFFNLKDVSYCSSCVFFFFRKTASAELSFT